MKVVLQRVSKAKVEIENKTVGEIGMGFLILLGIGLYDTEEDVDYLVNKIINLRVFSDQNDKFNLSVKDVKGNLLVVSQFTLFADTKKGNRPGFTNAAPPDLAEDLYNKFVEKCTQTSLNIQTGKFGSNMQINLINSGPVTILLDSKEKTYESH